MRNVHFVRQAFYKINMDSRNWSKKTGHVKQKPRFGNLVPTIDISCSINTFIQTGDFFPKSNTSNICIVQIINRFVSTTNSKWNWLCEKKITFNASNTRFMTCNFQNNFNSWTLGQVRCSDPRVGHYRPLWKIDFFYPYIHVFE